VRNVIVLSGFLVLGGCSTLSGIKTNADAVKGAADDAKSQKDAAKGQVDDEKAKAMAAKNGGGEGGGSAPAGATRLEAGDGKLNEPISDKIDFKKGKINDWRKFALVGGKPGDIATFILHWDEESANLDVDVFDQFGVKIGKSPPRLEGQTSKKILVRIDDAGMYYVKVSGATKADSSIYTMEVKWKAAPKPAAPPVAAAPAPAPAPGAAAAAPGAAAAAPPCPTGMTCPPPGQPCPVGATCPPPPVDPNKVFGEIVSASRDGSTVTLYLDKGSAAGFKPGMQGTILEGPDGEKPLDGGAFSIAQVISTSKSIARSTTLQKAIGKNRRVLVNLAQTR
jgi:hypothetical protein